MYFLDKKPVFSGRVFRNDRSVRGVVSRFYG